MTSVSIDVQRGVARIGAGAKWAAVIEAAAPYGVLLYVRTQGEPAGPFWTTKLVKANEAGGDLRLDLGGTMVLVFFAPPTA